MGTSEGTWFGNEPYMIITIEEEGSSTLQLYEAKVTDIKQSGGNQDTDTIQLFANTQITFQKPQEEYEVSMDVVFADTTFDGIYYGNYAAGAGTELKSSDSGKRYRITVWWADVEFQGTAKVPPNTGEVYRWVFKNCRAISWEPEIASDDHMKGTLTFNTAAVDKDGYANVYKEWTSAQSTTALTAISGATTTRYGGTLTWTSTTTKAWTSGY